MQDMIKDLRTNLGIPEYDNPDDEGFGFSSSKKLTKSDLSPPGNLESNDSLLMTRQAFDLKQLRSGRRGSRGLNLNSRTALHDVLEVQEDDLSGESGRTAEQRKKEKGEGECSDDEASLANDTLRTERNSTLGFDEIDSYLGKTQLLYREDSNQKDLSPQKAGSLQFGKGDSKKLSVGLEMQKKEERKATEGGVLAQESSARRKRRTPEHVPRKLLDQTSQSSTPFVSPERLANHSPPETDRSLELQVVMYEDGHQPDIQMVETTLRNPGHGIKSPIEKLDSPEPIIKSPASNTNSPVPKVRSSQLKAKTPEPNHSDKPLHAEYVSKDSSELAGNSMPAIDTVSERNISTPMSHEMHSERQVDTKANEEGEGGATERAENDGTGGFDDDSSEFLDTLGAYKHSLEITDNYDDDDYEEEEEDEDEKRTGFESPRPGNPLSRMEEQANDDF